MIWSQSAARVVASSTVKKRQGVPFALQAMPQPLAAAAVSARLCLYADVIGSVPGRNVDYALSRQN